MVMVTSGTTGTRVFGNISLSNIVPFSYRDGMTFQKLLYEIRDEVTKTIPDSLNAKLASVISQLNLELETMGDRVIRSEEEWKILFTDFMANVKENIGQINDAVIDEHVQRLKDIVDKGIERLTNEISDASDPTAYLNRVRHFVTVPARPVGSLWPQAFSVNEAENHIYVAYSGSIDGGVTPITRISVFDMAGKIVGFKQFIQESGTSSEGLVWWRNGLGDLCFAVRPANAGRGYAIYNYDKDSLGPVIPLPGGNYKSAVAGDYFYTVNSNDSTNGFNQVYVYTFASIQAGTPEKVETIYMEARNRMEKVQSFTVNGGYIIFNHGASKGNILMSTYNLNGRLVTAFTLNKEEFADALNRDVPGMIKDRTYYRHEGEGAWVYRGKTLTGHVVDNNSNDYKFVITAHNSVNGSLVESRPESMAYDTGWIDIPLNPPITAWDEASTPRIRRIGNVIYCDGAVKNVPTAFPALGHVVANIKDFAPSRQKELPIQESTLAGYASWKIRPGGDLVIAETTAPNPGTDTWYPFDFTWVQG